MDVTVNDFLKEINEIAPLNEEKCETVWEKCFDEDSGYHYYWNTKTNVVTWDVPSDYVPSTKSKAKSENNLYIPPRTTPLFPSTSGLLPVVSDAIRIYKIGESSDQKPESIPTKNKQKPAVVKKKTITKDLKRFNKNQSDSDDEKIILISSYGDDSEESEEETIEESRNVSSKSDGDEDIDLLTRIQQRAGELKELGGELPPEVKKIVEKPISGFSLIAGYSDSEEESDSTQDITETTTITIEEPTVAHSTLFPIAQRIDVRDFEEETSVPTNDDQEKEEGFIAKAFQRKRRIGVHLVNTSKKVRKKEDGDDERKGLGFSGESSENNYTGFKSGGVMFLKAETLQPNGAPDQSDNVDDTVILPEVEDNYMTLKEKLSFLSEGKETVSPVQVMLIQLETLHTALKSKDLRQSYLRKWLNETSADMVKLEKETAPEGWLLQWDRSHKRYYYQNAVTGENQWEYPQADVTRRDEAMDICTTPPPNGLESAIQMVPPPPPTVTPSPPPPPLINDSKTINRKKPDLPNNDADRVPQPLPPGTDGRDSDLSDALSSFYSDIAAIDTSNSPQPSDTNDNKPDQSEIPSEQIKKKKKTKVKIAQGIAMKKKGVSKLVEKWKNVQFSYDD